MEINKVGIISTDCFSMSKPINFKKLYLYFDKILADIYLADIAIQMFPKNQIVRANGREMLYLAEKDVLQFLTSKDDAYLKADLLNAPHIPAPLKNLPASLVVLNLGNTINYARKTALDLQSKGMDITPIYTSTKFLEPTHNNDLLIGKKAEVIRFVFSELPEPANDVSWEQLIEFKKDAATRNKFYRLVRWINDVSKDDMSVSEIRDSFYSLYYDYQHQFNIHKMKYNLGLAEVIITATSELLSGKFGALGSTLSLLSVKKQQLLLMEAEVSIPGREVAYILEAKKHLGAQ